MCVCVCVCVHRKRLKMVRCVSVYVKMVRGVCVCEYDGVCVCVCVCVCVADMSSERNVLLMEVLLFFSRMEGSSSNRRSHSPTPTCVSMKSDNSMPIPNNFTGEDSSNGQ